MVQQTRADAQTKCESCGTEYATPAAAAYCCLESD